MITLLFLVLVVNEKPQVLRGIVVDESGKPVSHARISAHREQTTTDSSGYFVLAVVSESSVLTIQARGFAPLQFLVNDPGLLQRVVVSRVQYAEEMVVTATKDAARVSETASSVVVLSAEELRASAAPTLDDALRQVPGFTLFRRSGSRTANPTTQGATLRGIGASGASRAVVLDDGIPLNDPFGGWVYWGRVPRTAIAQIEIVRGGVSELYGNGALSGVIQLIRRPTEVPDLEAEASYGSEETAEGSLYLSTRRGAWSGALGAELFRTDGYIAVPEPERGLVDTPVNSRRGSAELTISRELDPASRLFLRASIFDESRANGTPLQVNDTNTRQIALGLQSSWPHVAFSGRGYGLDQLYHQSFSAIAEDRQSERLTRLQEVPVRAVGASGEVAAFGGDHMLIAGADARRVEGVSEELIFGAATTRAEAGGTQRITGFFAEYLWRPQRRFSLTAAARLDSWKNLDARQGSTALSDRDDQQFSPRIAGMVRITDHVSLAVSAYRAFRAPTLNELYRSFRVGNVLTLANENLGAEKLSGMEASLILRWPQLTVRATPFRMEVERNIANITLSVQPNLITRQRQNLGETRSEGLELDVQGQLLKRIDVSAGYLYVNPKVRSFPPNVRLERLLIPQVPRHQASIQLRFADLALQSRWIGDQFEDDQNQLRLGSYTTVDILISRRLSANVELRAALENLLDEDYEIGRTPVPTLGPRRFARLGLRWHR